MTANKETYLFDWGDTLMVDFPGVPGKMCDWDKVEVVEGAKEALQHLSKKAKIYIATGAADSSEKDIQAAFVRVGLDTFITGYFCKANIGAPKGSPEYLPRILETLKQRPERVTMVGDSLEKDIDPAIKCGIKAIWFSKEAKTLQQAKDRVRTIRSLKELCID